MTTLKMTFQNKSHRKRIPKSVALKKMFDYKNYARPHIFF